MNSSIPDLMADPTPSTPGSPSVPSISIAADPNLPKLEVGIALAALANPIRWRAIQLMANGEYVTATQVAEAVGRDFDGVSKHMRLLRVAGVVASAPAANDRRSEVYYVPAQFRPMPGVVDFGFCVLRLPKQNAAV